VGEMSFLLSVFAVIEHLNKSELPNTSKRLIINYVNEATGAGMAEKARAAIWKYTQIVLPSLEAIRQKSTSQKLDKLDHLVLKMEFQASRLE
jgi:MinD-like ATPase involved in chromosome partitioning or flagellar assembly